MATAIEPIEVCEPNTAEWLEARRFGIGSSELAVAAGLSQWSTARELYHKKRGELPEREDNRATRLGRRLEPIVIAEFCDETGEEVDKAPCPMYRHPEHGFILATPDALLRSRSVLEAKTTSFRFRQAWGEAGTDDIPVEYLCQVQGQIGVVGCDVGHVACLVDGRNLLRHRVERNDDLIELLIDAARELWERIRDGKPPEPNWEHASTPRLIRELYGNIHKGERVELSAEAAVAWQVSEEAARVAREETQRRELMRAKVFAEMGGAEIGLLPGGDEVIVRKLVKRKGYTVEPSSYVTATKKACK